MTAEINFAFTTSTTTTTLSRLAVAAADDDGVMFQPRVPQADFLI
jgi:hypothetical protein